mgnify:CR=1 FL=1|tara:strand:+ start:43 stop:366 length:324 start_codon:yes stop_codon:yes gene_type:complete
MKAVKFKINETHKGNGEVAGVDFTLLKRTNDLCIFKRSDDWYEVVTLRHTKGRTSLFKGQAFVTYDSENYRQGDEWGGKIVKTLEKAEYLFNENIANKNNKKFNFNK